MNKAANSLKIAITGAEGFLGTALTKKLKSKKISFSVFNFKKHNLFEVDSLKSLVYGKNVIIHLAAINRGDNIELIKTNILGTLCLLEAITKYAPGAKIIFASSFQVYLNEGLYGLSKKSGEDLIIDYAKKGYIKAMILRFSNLYGPFGKPFYNSVIATFTHLIKNNQSLRINGDGSSKRDYIYIDDAVDGIIKAAQKKINKNFEIIDICSGKETSLKEIIKILEKVSRKKVEVVYNTKAMDKPWPTGTKNAKLAKSLLNWQPTTPIEKGLVVTMRNG